MHSSILNADPIYYFLCSEKFQRLVQNLEEVNNELIEQNVVLDQVKHSQCDEKAKGDSVDPTLLSPILVGYLERSKLNTVTKSLDFSNFEIDRKRPGNQY